MPFTIETEDGIIIEDIPDDIAPDADIIKQRVATIRQQRDSGVPIDKQVGTPQQEEPSFIESGLGVLEAGLALATGGVAEPTAGFGGVARATTAGPEEATKTIEQIREGLTFQPRTEAGRETLATVRGILEPVAETFEAAAKFSGDKVFDITGSPFLAAAASTGPTAISMLIGGMLGRGAFRVKQKRGLKKDEAEITEAIIEATPTTEGLFNRARQVYDELDNLGVTIKQPQYNRLIKDIEQSLIKNGLDPDITPSSTKALNRLKGEIGSDVSLSKLDTLRKVASNAAKSTERADAALGNIIIDNIDNFLSTSGQNAFNVPAGANIGSISSRYRIARELWGRGRKSELISDALVSAERTATGFENGIRIELRKILNNKKQNRFFDESELKLIEEIVKGKPGTNLAKKLGSLGISTQQGGTGLMALLGVGGGAAMGGIPGAVILPAIGTVSRSLAQRLTSRQAKFANEIIKAGPDANKIARAYFRNTPKNQRNPAELAELLLNKKIDFSNIPRDEISRQAVSIVRETRAAGATAIGVGAIPQSDPRLSLELTEAVDK